VGETPLSRSVGAFTLAPSNEKGTQAETDPEREIADSHFDAASWCLPGVSVIGDIQD